jgi:hypothetical protein
LPDSIVFNTIAVNGMEDNAGVFVGQTTASGWTSHSKTQGSIVSVIGFYNTLPHNLNILNDNDVIDTQINDYDYHGPISTNQL